jgi:membrane-associated phospholipid phosphatase
MGRGEPCGDRAGGRSAPMGRSTIFRARPGGVAEAIGSRFGSRTRIVAAVTIWVVAFAALLGLIVGLGFILTHVLAHGSIGRFDTSVSRWFFERRTDVLNPTTRVGSDLGSTGVVLAIAALALLFLIVRKHWTQIVFLVCALTLEFGVFIVTTLLVARPRPAVPRLDVAPPTSSYPSGHTATAVALYVGLAIVIGSLIRSALLRRPVWVPAVALPIFIAISRVYRGMHFPTDVIAGLLLGACALLCALLATRAMTAASAVGGCSPGSVSSPHPPPEVRA